MFHRDIEIGQIINDRYKVIRLLGSGAGGVVYLALDQKESFEIALKMLTPELWDSPQALKRFHRESRVAQSVEHPNVLPLLGSGVFEKTPFHVLEFCPGGTLAQNLPRLSTNESAALKLMLQVAKGIEALHSRNIIHRDIKTSNILVDKAEVLKVADFGLARWQSTELSHTLSLGTPITLAPEIWDGEKSTRLSDIYALGVVFYEILTLERPFTADSVAGIATAHMFQTPPSPSNFRDCSVHIESLIGQMLAKKKRDRIQSVEEVSRYLMALQTNENTATTITKTSTSPEESVKRNFLPLLQLTLVAGLALFFCIILQSMLKDAHYPKRPLLAYFDLSKPLHYAFINFRYTGVDGKEWESKTSNHSFNVTKGSPLLFQHWLVENNGRELLDEIQLINNSSEKAGAFLTRWSMRKSEDSIFRCPTKSCSMAFPIEHLWIPQFKGDEPQVGDQPFAIWSSSKETRVRFITSEHSTPHLQSSNPQFAMLWKFHDWSQPEGRRRSAWYGSKLLRWPYVISEKNLLAPTGYATELQPSSGIMLRHLGGCKPKTHILDANFWGNCRVFLDQLFAIDKRGRSLGNILRVTGSVVGGTKSPSMKVSQISIALAPREESPNKFDINKNS